MPVSTLSPTPIPPRPFRVFINIDLNTLREYDPSIEQWSLTDNGNSLLLKSRDTLTSIARDIHQLLFGSDTTVPKLHLGLRGHKDQWDHATIRLAYGYSFRHVSYDTPVVEFNSQSVQDKKLVFAVKLLSDEQRKIVNENLALQHARTKQHPDAVMRTLFAPGGSLMRGRDSML